MVALLGLVLISFFISSFLLIPFIDLLFFLRSRKKKGESATNIDTPIHNKLLAGKDVHTPVGGGILVIIVTIILSLFYLFLFKPANPNQLYILILSFLLFGGIGLIDDVAKNLSTFSGKYKGLRGRYIFLLQIIFAFILAYLLYFYSGLNNIFLPIFGNVILGWGYIFIAAFSIVAFSNAYNISDGLDGLSSGLLLICLFAFLVLSHSVFNESLSVFTGLWLGGLIAFLYFNIYPARIYLGDAGAFGFGATLAIVGLLTGKIIGLAVIGGVYIIIVTSSLLQILSKRLLKRKLFPVAPLHMYLKFIGWEEPKIVFRLWLAGIIFAILGLWLSFLSN